MSWDCLQQMAWTRIGAWSFGFLKIKSLNFQKDAQEQIRQSVDNRGGQVEFFFKLEVSEAQKWNFYR